MPSYSHKHTVLRVVNPNRHMTGMIQFGRALVELSTKTLCANSSQAKARVERANRTLQDRLVEDLRLACASLTHVNMHLRETDQRHSAKYLMPKDGCIACQDS